MLYILNNNLYQKTQRTPLAYVLYLSGYKYRSQEGSLFYSKIIISLQVDFYYQSYIT